ncbi:MAG: DUF5060 domain-containing protein [Anaerolineae bacterium]
MTTFLFFFVIALCIRTLGNILKYSTDAIPLKKGGIFLVVASSWFAAAAFDFWSTLWPALVLGLIVCLLPYNKLFSSEESLVPFPHVILDIVAIVVLGLLSVPIVGITSIIQAAVIWLIAGFVVDESSRIVLQKIPLRVQKIGGGLAVAVGLVTILLNPADIAGGSYRILESRLVTVGFANPVAQFQNSEVSIERFSPSPFEVVSHIQDNGLLSEFEADSADPETYLPMIRNGTGDLIPANRFMPEYGEVVHAPIDIQFSNSSHSGNAFDLVAKVVFTHVATGERRVTEMFYTGGENWTARFTATHGGRWIYRTDSSDPDLDNLAGELNIEREPGLAGFVSYEGVTWVRSGNPTTAFIPQFMMYKDPDRYYDNPAVIDADIQEYMVEHGFNGLHVNVYCRWFELEKPRCGDITTASPNPDMRTFEALELLIAKVHAQGGTVHLWAWGDSSRTQNPQRWGYNGVEDQRLQRYIAARLGPMPGWTMGYGFDLFEWTNEKQLDTWVEYMHQHMGWSHMLGARSYKNRVDQISERMDYSGYEQHWPDYDKYVESILDRNDKPSFSEDRFRIDGKGVNKDYSPDMTRQGLWRSMMSGGIANIWGNLNLSDGGSYEIGSIPYPNKSEIKRYFSYSDQWYSKGLERCNQITDSYCLRNSDYSRLIFYKEDTSSIQIDLTGLPNQIPYVAVDTISGQEVTGFFEGSDQTWSAPSKSDWVIAVGDFE